jgi:hypothetical protein
MASFRAIAATCEAVARLLQQAWRTDLFDETELQFQVYRTRSFTTPMDTGVSIFLYRVDVNGVQRTPPAPPAPHGRRRPHQLPVSLHLLLTAWAREASLEHEILGWAMRTLEDVPSLSPGMLNALADGVFGPDEQVEIVPDQLDTENMLRIWDVLPGDFQLSVPYMARIVRIRSELDSEIAGPIVRRDLDFGVVRRP